MTGTYRIERSGQRYWRIRRFDGATLPTWEFRSRQAAQRRLDELGAGGLDAEWTQDHTIYETPTAAYDDQEE